MEKIAIDYNVTNSTLCDAIHWIKDTLVKSGLFALPSKRSLCEDESPDIVLIDVTKCETEPKTTRYSKELRKKRGQMAR